MRLYAREDLITLGAPMPRSLRLLVPLSALLGLIFATGCAAPCDRYCEITADYIELCLDSNSQVEWQDATDWSTWGAASKEEYLSACHTDLDAQLEGAENSAAIGQACEDDANRYLELTERALCADIP
jgi:hypothetical protein